MKPAVQLFHVSQVYVNEQGASLAIDKISLTVEQGEFVSLVGPSGCGKTTILSIIAGLLAPSAGEVRISGTAVNGPNIKVGYMLQQDYLFPWRTIYQNAIIGLELTGQLNEQGIDRVVQLLDDMGLNTFRDAYPNQLSGGMRQRVALVRTLATEPDLLLLDEPFSALDYQTKLKLEDLLVRTLKARHKTAILVTHDLSEAIAMSDRVIVLGRNPGTIRKQFYIPERIRAEEPFRAREQPGFHALFNDIWQQLESTEEKR